MPKYEPAQPISTAPTEGAPTESMLSKAMTRARRLGSTVFWIRLDVAVLVMTTVTPIANSAGIDSHKELEAANRSCAINPAATHPSKIRINPSVRPR